jgi:hypothetical protein
MMATGAGVGLGTALRSSLRGDSRTLLLSKPSEVASHAEKESYQQESEANVRLPSQAFLEALSTPFSLKQRKNRFPDG